MRIKRTDYGHRACDDWEDMGWTGGTEVHVTDKPTHSPVLGPDGNPLEYWDEPFGFVLTARK